MKRGYNGLLNAIHCCSWLLIFDKQFQSECKSGKNNEHGKSSMQ